MTARYVARFLCSTSTKMGKPPTLVIHEIGIAIYIHMPPYTLGFDLFSPPAEGIEGFHHAQLNRQEKG